MNNPVGIPSGWEEIAAWVWVAYSTYRVYWLDGQILHTTYAEGYANCPHDWRVER